MSYICCLAQSTLSIWAYGPWLPNQKYSWSCLMDLRLINPSHSHFNLRLKSVYIRMKGETYVCNRWSPIRRAETWGPSPEEKHFETHSPPPTPHTSWEAGQPGEERKRSLKHPIVFGLVYNNHCVVGGPRALDLITCWSWFQLAEQACSH